MLLKSDISTKKFDPQRGMVDLMAVLNRHCQIYEFKDSLSPIN